MNQVWEHLERTINIINHYLNFLAQWGRRKCVANLKYKGYISWVSKTAESPVINMVNYSEKEGLEIESVQQKRKKKHG